MDVRCDRCKTEYEFDEDRITDAGVAVRCTHCGHVFMVKKKAVAVALPILPGVVAAGAPPPQPIRSIPMARESERPKEWKVRQPNGNLITFKELTTLQKWIVERKVSRDDEISLTGDSWKRLGNIAELSSFFQVVDEARHAAHRTNEPAAARPAPSGVTPPTGIPKRDPGKPATPPQPIPPVVVSLEESIEQAPVARDAPPPAPAPPQGPSSMGAFENFSFRKPAGPQRTAGFETAGAVGAPPPTTNEPAFASRQPATQLPEDDLALAAAAGLAKNAQRPWHIALFVLLLGAVSYLAYRYFVWIPEQRKQAQIETADRESVAKADQERAEGERIARERAQREQAEKERAAQARAAAQRSADDSAKASANTSSERGPQEKTAPPPPLTKARPDAGAPEGEASPGADRSVPGPLLASPDAGKSKTVAKVEAPEDFNGYMDQGDRLREREQPRSALAAYAKASEMEPARPEPFTGSGLALLDLGKTTSAIAAFKQALKIDPRYGLALMGLAEAYRTEGNKEEAIRYYEKYLEVLPDGPEAEVAKTAIKDLQE